MTLMKNNVGCGVGGVRFVLLDMKSCDSKAMVIKRVWCCHRTGQVGHDEVGPYYPLVRTWYSGNAHTR